MQTIYSRHAYVPAPNRLTTLTVTAPRQVVVSDITYLSLPRGVFVDLFLITYLFSRHIVGWHLSHRLSDHAALQALDAAQQTLGDCLGIVHHADRGTPYCCQAYRQQLRALRMIPSTTDGAHCYRNAVAERVNGILKAEFNLDAVFPTLTDAQDVVASAIHRFNTIRTHGSLERPTPCAVFSQAA